MFTISQCLKTAMDISIYSWGQDLLLLLSFLQFPNEFSFCHLPNETAEHVFLQFSFAGAIRFGSKLSVRSEMLFEKSDYIQCDTPYTADIWVLIQKLGIEYLLQVQKNCLQIHSITSSNPVLLLKENPRVDADLRKIGLDIRQLVNSTWFHFESTVV